MTLRITTVTINRDVHPNTVFVVLQNPAGESAKVQIHFQSSMNVNDFTLKELERMAHEELKRLED
ncbi:hypothetical protein KZJ38_08750 [Paraburkholderia edwinii]|jgi:hypothetical protein|uniref:Uncharacterized protein n=1 Tax=Paraburkholderia edwinii TaxID=2861782 RepID=A0ABX8UTW9_9BURK|nr:hypothetical protein [Paraburkholderia edwinii]QYD70360.1 hypothetical protein KZJ38_08750 [Paraburkholderia edwinii]